jgi:hypothetical protein
MIATAKVYTLVFAVVLVAIELVPGPFFGPAPSWADKLLQTVPGLALLAIGWVWMLSIRRGIDRP